MKKVNLLSRAEMRQVIGGIVSMDQLCLYCVTDQHSSCWYRKSTAPDSLGECNTIYPNDTGLVAMYGTCSEADPCIWN